MSTRPRIAFDDRGWCNACQWMEEKKKIDWEPVLEPAIFIKDDPDIQTLIWRMRLEKGKAVPGSTNPPRQDEHHSNRE